MNNKKRVEITEELKQAMRKFRKAGNTVRRTAQRFDVSEQTVYNCTERQKQTRSSRSKRAAEKAQFMREKNITLKVIAEEVGMSITWVMENTSKPQMKQDSSLIGKRVVVERGGKFEGLKGKIIGFLSKRGERKVDYAQVKTKQGTDWVLMPFLRMA